jgi:hypothetical protein
LVGFAGVPQALGAAKVSVNDNFFGGPNSGPVERQFDE